MLFHSNVLCLEKKKKRSWRISESFFICKVQKIFGQAEITRFCPSHSPPSLFFFNCSYVLAASFPSGELVQVQRVTFETEQPLMTFFVMLASRKSQWKEFYPYQQTAERSLFQRPLISVTLGVWSFFFFSFSILKT